MNKNRRDLSLSLLCAALLLCNSCKTNNRPVPPGPGGLPAQAGETPGAANLVHPSSQGDTPALPPGHPAMPADHPAALHGAHEQTDEPAAAGEAALPDLSKRVAGTLKLTDQTRAKVPAGATVFLVARAYSDGGAPGQVLAVKKMTADRWPLAFELSSSDAMMEGFSLAGKVVVTARVDQDGDAMTKMPGDVEGISKPIAVPAKGIEILMDKIRTEAAGPPPGAGPMGGMGGQMGGTMGGAGEKPPGHP